MNIQILVIYIYEYIYNIYEYIYIYMNIQILIIYIYIYIIEYIDLMYIHAYIYIYIYIHICIYCMMQIFGLLTHTCHFTRQNTYTLDYRERWVLIDLQAKIDLNIGTMIFNVFDTLKHKMCGDRRHTTNAQTLIWRINFSTGTPANELVFYSSWANIIYLRCNTPPISMHVNVPVIFQHMDFTHTQHGIWRYCNELQHGYPFRS